MQAFGNDLAGETLQAKLRGLSCNDVLVLVNGKRRHGTANIEIDPGDPYQGCAGVDWNFIPLDSIDHIEVLTDGAAAQYGTDAIAGVINIILKKDASGGSVSGTYGNYMDGGGNTGDVSANAGFAPIENSYVNLTAEVHHHGDSNRGAIDPRVINAANSGTYPNDNVVNAPGYPYLNGQEGDAGYELKIFSINAGFDFGNGQEFYAFGTYGDKRAAAYQNYRTPSKVSYTDPTTDVTTYPFPFGFDPQESTHETDYSATAGFKGVIAQWNWDLSSTFGGDKPDIYTLNSANNGVYGATGVPTPSNYYDGYLQTTQWTSTLDFNRDFDVGLAGPLNVAYGAEYRRETYAVGAGVPISYLDGGAQSYPGFTPTDAGCTTGATKRCMSISRPSRSRRCGSMPRPATSTTAISAVRPSASSRHATTSPRSSRCAAPSATAFAPRRWPRSITPPPTSPRAPPRFSCRQIHPAAGSWGSATASSPSTPSI